MLGISQTTIANYEQGIRFPDEARLGGLADCLGASVDELLGREPPAGARPPADAALAPEAALAFDSLLEGTPWLKNWCGAELARGRGLAEIFVDVLQPALYELGRRWESGRLDVYQEHAASNRAIEAIAALTTESGPADKRFLGFACGGEQHDIGLRMVTKLLEADGWRTLYLGTDLPALSLLAAVAGFRPHVVGIGATLPRHLDALARTVALLRAELRQACPPIMVGGLAFALPEGAGTDCGADAVARDGKQAVAVARRLAGG